MSVVIDMTRIRWSDDDKTDVENDNEGVVGIQSWGLM